MPSRVQVLRRRAFERQAGRCVLPRWLTSPDELSLEPPSRRAAARLRCTAELKSGRETKVR